MFNKYRYSRTLTVVRCSADRVLEYGRNWTQKKWINWWLFLGFFFFIKFKLDLEINSCNIFYPVYVLEYSYMLRLISTPNQLHVQYGFFFKWICFGVSSIRFLYVYLWLWQICVQYVTSDKGQFFVTCMYFFMT